MSIQIPVKTDRVEKQPDRRRSQRKPHVVEAFISSPTATDPSDRDEVRAVNLSRHGVAFERDEAIPPGTYHVIDILLGSQRLRCEVRIISCRRVADGRHELGAEFC